MSFADYKFLSIGLLNSLRNTSYLTPASSIKLRGLSLSIFQFIHLFINDLLLGIFNDNFSFLKFWFGWKKGAEIFYSILNFNTLKDIVKNSDQCEFFSLPENQVTNRSFSLGTIIGKLKYKNNCKLSTYFCTPFSLQNKPQYIPKISEINAGFWGNIFYMQDKDSYDEMRKHLKNINKNLEVKIVEKKMRRTTRNILKEKFRDEEIRGKIINTANESKKNITIFSHDSYSDLLGCIFCIFNKENQNFWLDYKLFNKNNYIYIRLHPSLSEKVALRKIKLIKEIPDNIKFIFVDKSKESINVSINNSKNCIFGLSTYINLAIRNNCEVIAVRTNHIYKNPIKDDLSNLSNLSFIIPW